MMGRLRQAILATMLVLMSLTGAAQFNPERVCRVADGRLIFTLDRRWTQAQKKEVQKLFSLDSAVMAAAYSLKPVITDKGLTWKVRKMDDNWVELSRDPGSVTAKGDPDGQLFLLDDDWIETPGKKNQPTRFTGSTGLQGTPWCNWITGASAFSFRAGKKPGRSSYPDPSTAGAP